MDKVQRSPEYYKWLYEDGPRPEGMTDREARSEAQRVLGKLPKKFKENENSIINNATPEQRKLIAQRRKEYKEQLREMERYHANGDMPPGTNDSHLLPYDLYPEDFYPEDIVEEWET